MSTEERDCRGESCSSLSELSGDLEAQICSDFVSENSEVIDGRGGSGSSG